MKIISHRGNLSGRIPERENSPLYILEAIDYGFDVEVDVWYTGNKFFLGHDAPQYEVEKKFLTNPSFWCHAKNSEALYQLLQIGSHCFWHENDSYTLTSRGIPWCYPERWIAGGITVVLNKTVIPDFCGGVCVDDPLTYVKK